ncbi:MAG: HupE/UreJ family protein [Steroidobacteraceae bacterium]
MRRFITSLWITLIGALLGAPYAQAHDVPPSALLLDIGTNQLNIELQLPLSELGTALELPLSEQPQQALTRYHDLLRDYVLAHLRVTGDAQAQALPYSITLKSLTLNKTSNSNWSSNDWLVAQLQLQAPAGNDTQRFTIDYDGIVQRVVTHNTFVSVRRDFRNGMLGEQPQLLGLIGFQQTRLVVDRSNGSWWQGFKAVFHMGLQHIAEGTDHLMFLLVLLLPAPLLAGAHRWQQADRARHSTWRIIKTVSGFTLGHSLTLALAASNMLRVPTQPVEVLIALSIIVSAMHAWRPLFAGRESWIATGFGLIHGLAFASALSGFNYDHWVLVSSLLAFNLGIEAMQLLVVAAVLPWLLLLSRSRAYAWLRCTVAIAAVLAAAGWICERAIGVNNPLQPYIDFTTQHAAMGLMLLMMLALLLEAQRRLLLREAPSPRTSS